MHQHTDALAGEIARKAQELRIENLKMVYRMQTGHLGGPFSAAEILAALYFHQLRIDPDRPDWPERDRFILSKGHAAPILYAALAHRGFFPLEELETFRTLGTRLEGHPDRKLPGRGAGRRTAGPRRGRRRRHGLGPLAAPGQALRELGAIGARLARTRVRPAR